MYFEHFRSSMARHGLAQTLRRTVFGRLSRIVEFEICRVETNDGRPYDWPDVKAYETRVVDEETFHGSLCDEIADVNYHWAFARGDICVASFHDREIVGYSFYSALPTRARDDVMFEFPTTQYVYSFASATAPSHRGNRLEQDRWKVGRRHRIESLGRDPKLIWYVNVNNLESRATNKAVRMQNLLLGYIAYVNVNGRYHFFRSPGCREAQAGFVRPDSERQTQ